MFFKAFEALKFELYEEKNRKFEFLMEELLRI